MKSWAGLLSVLNNSLNIVQALLSRWGEAIQPGTGLKQPSVGARRLHWKAPLSDSESGYNLFRQEILEGKKQRSKPVKGLHIEFNMLEYPSMT
jgi:hypothetical protein